LNGYPSQPPSFLRSKNMRIVHQNVAGLDVHKKVVVAAIIFKKRMVPGYKPGAALVR